MKDSYNSKLLAYEFPVLNKPVCITTIIIRIWCLNYSSTSKLHVHLHVRVCIIPQRTHQTIALNMLVQTRVHGYAHTTPTISIQMIAQAWLHTGLQSHLKTKTCTFVCKLGHNTHFVTLTHIARPFQLRQT